MISPISTDTHLTSPEPPLPCSLPTVISHILKSVLPPCDQTLRALVTVLNQHRQQEAICEQLRLLAADSSSPEQKLHQISALLYLLHTHVVAPKQSDITWVERIAINLQATLRTYKNLHARTLSEKSYRTLIPKGVTHRLLLHFAQILCPDTWNPAGTKLVRYLLVECHLGRFLQEEHVAQILTLLTYDLESEFCSVDTVHPSMEIIIQATLGLPLFVKIQPRHVRQALLMALLSCVRQESKEPNCYLIACIPYLIGQTPHHFVSYLYSMLKSGQILLERHSVKLTNFFPLLKLPTTWINITVPVDQLLKTRSLTRFLSSHKASTTQSYTSTYRAIAHLAQDSKWTFSNAQLYLQAMTNNPILALFIASTELQQCVSMQSHILQAIRQTIETEMRKHLSSLQEPDRIKLIETFNTSLVCSNVPSLFATPFKPLLHSLPTDKMMLCCNLREHAVSLCLIQDGHCQPLLSFQNLLLALSKHIQTLLPHFNIALFSPSFIPQLASVAASSFALAPSSVNTICARDLQDFEMFVFFKQGGQSLPVLQTVLPHQALSVVDIPSCSTIEELLYQWHAKISSNLQTHPRSYLVLSLDHHIFFAHLYPEHPFLMTPDRFDQTLKQLVTQGEAKLAQTCSIHELSRLIDYCYEDTATVSDLRLQFNPTLPRTVAQVIDTLLSLVNPDDQPALCIRIQEFFSFWTLSTELIQDFISYFAPHLDARYLSQKFFARMPKFLHPYQFCYYLHKLLNEEGLTISQFSLAQYQQTYLELGDLNHTPLNKEKPKHIHLLAEFNFTTKRLGLFHASKYNTSSSNFKPEQSYLIF